MGFVVPCNAVVIVYSVSEDERTVVFRVMLVKDWTSTAFGLKRLKEYKLVEMRSSFNKNNMK